MSDDFAKRPPGGWSYGPPPGGGAAGGGPPGHKPPGGWSYGPPGGDGGDDIWGEPGSGEPAGVGEVFQNFMLLLTRSFTGILWVFGGLHLIYMTCVCFQIGVPWTLAYAQVGDGSIVGYSSLGFSLCAFSILFVIMVVSMGMLRPMRIALVEGPDAVGGVMGTLREAVSKVIPALILAIIGWIICTIGFILCVIPGFIAMIYMMIVAHLVIACDVGFGEAFGEGVRLLQMNIGPAIAMLVLFFVVMAVNVGCMIGAGAGAAAIGPEIGPFITAIVNAVVYSSMLFLMGLLSGAFTTTIETADADVAIYYE